MPTTNTTTAAADAADTRIVVQNLRGGSTRSSSDRVGTGAGASAILPIAATVVKQVAQPSTCVDTVARRSRVSAPSTNAARSCSSGHESVGVTKDL